MHFKSFASLTATVLLATMSVSAMPLNSQDIVRRDAAPQACEVCTDCSLFDDNDTCVTDLPKNGGSNNAYNFGNDSHVAVQFGHDTSQDHSYSDIMTIASNENNGNEYNVQVTYNKVEHDNMDKVISTTKVPFFYKIKGPKVCSMELPGYNQYFMGDVDSVKVQLI